MWPLIKIIPTQANFKFVKYARVFAALSVILVIGSIALSLTPFRPPCGGLACGIDFRGGTVMEISTPTPIDLSLVRGTLSQLEMGDVQVQAFGSPSAALVRFESPEDESPAVSVGRVQQALTGALGEVSFDRTDVVGPKVSGELFRSGLMALGLAISLMLIYIWFRFELQFGVGAVVALFHDVILTFGLIALFRLEFNLQAIAGILTIIGYSMNDTVVVFDRLRENLRKYKRMPLGEVIDLSINETLSRTIITSVTTIFALIALLIFGGPTLFGLSVIMLFGIFVGTYSSIYIAAPVILLWGIKRGEDEAAPLTPAGAKA